jgi:hypothetical protein
LEGTPGIGDIGNYEIVLRGSDSLFEVQQTFGLEVKAASIFDISILNGDGIHVYPNPIADGVLNLKLDNGIQEPFDVFILDLTGKLLIQKHFENANLLSVDVSSLPPAMYLVRIRSQHIQYSEKFLIQ